MKRCFIFLQLSLMIALVLFMQKIVQADSTEKSGNLQISVEKVSEEHYVLNVSNISGHEIGDLKGNTNIPAPYRGENGENFYWSINTLASGESTEIPIPLVFKHTDISSSDSSSTLSSTNTNNSSTSTKKATVLAASSTSSSKKQTMINTIPKFGEKYSTQLIVIGIILIAAVGLAIFLKKKILFIVFLATMGAVSLARSVSATTNRIEEEFDLTYIFEQKESLKTEVSFTLLNSNKNISESSLSAPSDHTDEVTSDTSTPDSSASISSSSTKKNKHLSSQSTTTRKTTKSTKKSQEKSYDTSISKSISNSSTSSSATTTPIPENLTVKGRIVTEYSYDPNPDYDLQNDSTTSVLPYIPVFKDFSIATTARISYRDNQGKELKHSEHLNNYENPIPSETSEIVFSATGYATKTIKLTDAQKASQIINLGDVKVHKKGIAGILIGPNQFAPVLNDAKLSIRVGKNNPAGSIVGETKLDAANKFNFSKDLTPDSYYTVTFTSTHGKGTNYYRTFYCYGENEPSAEIQEFPQTFISNN